MKEAVKTKLTEDEFLGVVKMIKEDGAKTEDILISNKQNFEKIKQFCNENNISY